MAAFPWGDAVPTCLKRCQIQDLGGISGIFKIIFLTLALQKYINSCGFKYIHLGKTTGFCLSTPFWSPCRFKEYSAHRCYPPQLIFRPLTPVADDIKVVLLGQDPPGQAHGLCFSVPEGVGHPPSLINIFKEIEQDLDLAYPESGNLLRWAKQGVFLLNATLTVRAHDAGSHQKQGWEVLPIV